MAREGLAGIRVGISWLHRLEMVVEGVTRVGRRRRHSKDDGEQEVAEDAAVIESI
jgi:hypothetical protein